MEGTKVHVGIGTIYRRIHQFPLIIWPILLVHHGMFEAWKWLTLLLEGGHHGLWAKVH
jgi:hypothetical protein